MSGTGDHHVKWRKAGSKRQKLHVSSHMSKIDSNNKSTQHDKYIYK
jgi:hypothetical protein